MLQKVPASSPHKKEWDERIEAYASSNPDAYVVDLPSAVRRVANRETMLDAVRAVASSAKRIVDSDSCVVRAPKQIVAVAGTEQQVRAQVDAASLRFPLLAKSSRADGSSDSHKVAIIHDEDGLACVARGAVPGLKPPCVIQEYVNHGGCLFKVYVVGEDVTMTRRKSLPDLRGARRASRRRKAAAENAAAELAAARGEGPAATRDARGAKPRVPVGGVGGKKEDTADVDGDVDDSEEDLDDDEGDEGDEGDGSARRRRRATGAQSVSRVSCFRGGATEGETSWRDRLTEDERRRMSYSPRASAESPLESPSPLRLHQSFARNLTISRVGSVDSIGGASVVSGHPSVGRELDGEGDGSGGWRVPHARDGDGDGSVRIKRFAPPGAGRVAPIAGRASELAEPKRIVRRGERLHVHHERRRHGERGWRRGRRTLLAWSARARRAIPVVPAGDPSRARRARSAVARIRRRQKEICGGASRRLCRGAGADSAGRAGIEAVQLRHDSRGRGQRRVLGGGHQLLPRDREDAGVLGHVLSISKASKAEGREKGVIAAPPSSASRLGTAMESIRHPRNSVCLQRRYDDTARTS